MRRGLMRWDQDELPKRVLLDRRARLQAAIERDGLDAFLIYTNLVRPSAVCWLTGFTPYWIDSLLLIAQDGSRSWRLRYRSVSPTGFVRPVVLTKSSTRRDRAARLASVWPGIIASVSACWNSMLFRRDTMMT